MPELCPTAARCAHQSPSDFRGARKARVDVECTVSVAHSWAHAAPTSRPWAATRVNGGFGGTDRYWNAITRNGGAESACGWCKDRWGFSWQITPRVLIEATTSSHKAAAKRAFEAMMEMGKIDIAAIERAVAGKKSAA